MSINAEKLKLSQCSNVHLTVKTYGGLDVQLRVILTLHLDDVNGQVQALVALTHSETVLYCPLDEARRVPELKKNTFVPAENSSVIPWLSRL